MSESDSRKVKAYEVRPIEWRQDADRPQFTLAYVGEKPIGSIWEGQNFARAEHEIVDTYMDFDSLEEAKSWFETTHADFLAPYLCNTLIGVQMRVNHAVQ